MGHGSWVMGYGSWVMGYGGALSSSRRSNEVRKSLKEDCIEQLRTFLLHDRRNTLIVLKLHTTPIVLRQ